jgi:transketolase
MDQIKSGAGLCVAEEHVARGGFGAEVALNLAERGVHVGSFTHFSARKHLYEAYGSQDFLHRRSGISADNVLAWATTS